MNEEILYFMKKYPDCEEMASEIEAALYILKDCYENGNKVLIAGNGGSACDADHIVGELMKGFLRRRPIPEVRKNEISRICGTHNMIAGCLQGALPAISLSSHTGLLTAIGNDIGYDAAYAQEVYGYGKSGDVFWGISTSGNSVNIVNAAFVAKALDMKVLGLSGKSGGKLKELCDVCICVPSYVTFEIQEMHIQVYHLLCHLIEEYFFNGEVDRSRKA